MKVIKNNNRRGGDMLLSFKMSPVFNRLKDAEIKINKMENYLP